ncbi:hypothetical protein [Streptomyces kebangsaanensis]|uniref:hypothetical protein n=1 Tax=Streptomyces kebangsaanensis TaxID=864058 RepID=UPI00093DB971|nr:hypothetical protein [Streptomyces kebangsaanensis]
MRVPPARRLASGALCAALLVGVTGPAAMAAAPARERGHAASPDAPLPSADALRAQVGKLDAAGGGLTPVTDLLNAALEADGGRLPAAEARKLGDAAERALADSAKKAKKALTAKAPAAPAAPKAPRTVSERRAADITGDTPAAVQKDIDSLVAAIAAGDVDQVLAFAADLLADALDFVTDTLTDSDLSEAATSTGPASADTSAATPEAESPAVTLPAIALPEPARPPAA